MNVNLCIPGSCCAGAWILHGPTKPRAQSLPSGARGANGSVLAGLCSLPPVLLCRNKKLQIVFRFQIGRKEGVKSRAAAGREEGRKEWSSSRSFAFFFDAAAFCAVSRLQMVIPAVIWAVLVEIRIRLNKQAVFVYLWSANRYQEVKK